MIVQVQAIRSLGNPNVGAISFCTQSPDLSWMRTFIDTPLGPPFLVFGVPAKASIRMLIPESQGPTMSEYYAEAMRQRRRQSRA